ncbi:hypothetical protein BOTBODRAFT_300390 [Botryobasidium botryosum FD-172 SS1]|uniref:Uncharacterized protein n=1 Tax=Botryobasidium botryosum (strain FD-172 SS1) TaxID=930990 RepID=A0A067MJU8_BOTB1|nr:hypothetical protein BOTBODRAFT_300390 [Botryobasidium botryosum FD-172 SS1]
MNQTPGHSLLLGSSFKQNERQRSKPRSPYSSKNVINPAARPAIRALILVRPVSLISDDILRYHSVRPPAARALCGMQHNCSNILGRPLYEASAAERYTSPTPGIFAAASHSPRKDALLQGAHFWIIYTQFLSQAKWVCDLLTKYRIVVRPYSLILEARIVNGLVEAETR